MISEIKSVFDIVPDLLFFGKALLEMLYFLTQHIVHFQFFLHDILQLLNV